MVLRLVVYSDSMLTEKDCRFSTGALLIVEKRAMWCLVFQCSVTEQSVFVSHQTMKCLQVCVCMHVLTSSEMHVVVKNST